MFWSYQDESQRLPIVFVVQILLRQNKQNNHWLAVSLSHRRNGSVIYFGGHSGDLSLTLVLMVTPHTTAARSRNVRGPGWHGFYIQNLKESRLQYVLWEQLWHLRFLNKPGFQGGSLAPIDTAGTRGQSRHCKMDSRWCGPRQTPPAVTETLHGSAATRLYEPIVVDLPLHNFHQHKSACVQRSNLVGRVLVLSKFHG